MVNASINESLIDGDRFYEARNWHATVEEQDDDDDDQFKSFMN